MKSMRRSLSVAPARAMLLFVSLFACAAVCAAGDDDEFPRVSPFEAVRWSESTPEVQVRGAWYELIAIDGQPASEVVAFSKQAFESRWQKRFEEDLVQLLTKKGKPPGTFVSLELKDLESQKTVRLDRVEMTEKNRRAIWEAARRRAEAPSRRDVAPVRRVAREHSSAVAPELRRASALIDVETGGTLTRAQAEADLDQLEWAIENLLAYRDRTGFDYRASLDSVRAALSDRVRVGTLSVAISKAIAPLGDGHARVTPMEELLPVGFLPLLVEESAGRLVAVRSDRSSFVDPEKPFLAAIDGLDVERWLEAAGRLVAKGSPALVRRRSIRNLRYLAFLRRELEGRPTHPVELDRRKFGPLPTDTVEVELHDGRGSRTPMRLALSGSCPRYGDRFPSGHRLLEGNVGYLRIAEMDSDSERIDEILAALDRFRDTIGLVIDVRGNGGGSRDILLRLFPLLPPAAEGPTVANAARYRLRDGDLQGEREGYLDDRFLFPATSTRWITAQRGAIEAFARTFRPEWTPPGPGFSDWHYLVLGSEKTTATKPYAHPVVILQDSDCFSATDVFLSALHGLRGITTMGTASGGGSGRARPVTLEHSGLTVSLSSMVSYQRDGKLLDGNGVAPDVRVDPEPEDFLGHKDAVLRAAVERLRKKG